MPLLPPRLPAEDLIRFLLHPDSLKMPPGTMAHILRGDPELWRAMTEQLLAPRLADPGCERHRHAA